MKAHLKVNLTIATDLKRGGVRPSGTVRINATWARETCQIAMVVEYFRRGARTCCGGTAGTER